MSDAITSAECRGFIAGALSMPDIVEIRRCTTQDAVFRLDLAVTEMDPGQGMIREAIQSELPYGFGIGVAWMQVEGAVTDERSGEIVFAFVERRKHDGEVGLSWRRWFARVRCAHSGVARATVRELAESIALDVLREAKVVLIDRQ